VQVDPIKPALEAPRSKRLTLEYDELLSSFAFKFNLRRYTKCLGAARVLVTPHGFQSMLYLFLPPRALLYEVRRCRFTGSIRC